MDDKIKKALQAAQSLSPSSPTNGETNEATSFGRRTGSEGVSAQPFAPASASAAREEDGSLRGLPRKVGSYQASVHAPAVKVAEEYMQQAGLPYNPPNTYARVKPDRAARIAAEYDRMEHDPQHPKVKAAYDAMARETLAQYEAMLRAGMKVEFNPPGTDPYNGNPRAMTEDVRKNNHMWVFPTREGFGSSEEFDPIDNPLLAETPYKISGQPALVNDIFRAVHDYFGHVKEGVGFRHDGEENAWRAHSAMYSPLARQAMTTETRGQNSWVNFGPHGEKNRTASSEDTHYADQKIGLLPDWVVNEGAGDEEEPDHKAGGGSEFGDVDPEMVRKALEQVASPFSDDPDKVQKALDIARNTHRVLTDTSNKGGQSFFGSKGPMSPSQVQATIDPIPGATPKDPVKTDWEAIYKKYKGGHMLNLGGDRSRLGRLTHINGVKLAWPVDLHAGPDYMREPNKEAVWANAAGTSTGMINEIKRLSEEGPVVGSYVPMGPQTVDSAFHTIDTILSHIAANPPDKKAAEEFDNDVRSAAYVGGKKPADLKYRAAEAEKMQGWPGISDPWEAREWLRKNNISGGTRSLIVKHLDKAKWPKAGFPNVGVIRAAITNPDLISTPGNMMGYRLAELKPERATPTAFTHNTYPGAIKGSYIGDVPLVQRHYAVPDALDQILSKRYGKSKDLILHPYSPNDKGRSGFLKLMEMQKQPQPINQRMLDSIMLGIERQKKYGLKTGGKAVGKASGENKFGSDAVQNAVKLARQLKRGRP